MKIISRIIITITLVFFLGWVSVYLYLYWTAPKYTGELQLQGLKEPVEVYYDEVGIPHVYAKNEEDAYFALGYIHAQERLFQMEMMRRVASGRLAEILGKDFIETDKFMRGIGISQYAEECEQKYMKENKEPYQKAVNAYLKGLNTYLKQGNTPIEFTLLGIPKQDFTPKDVYLAAGYMAYTFAQGFKNDPLLEKLKKSIGTKYLNDLAIDYQAGTAQIPVFKPEKDSTQQKTKDTLQKNLTAGIEKISHLSDRIFEMLPVPILEGSNSWVVGAQKSTSGKVLFCNDPHIQYSQPSVWFEAHLEYPEVSLYGHYLAGVPFPNIGHNQYCAWGATMLQNDDVNFYLEKQNPNNANQYWEKDQWVDYKIRKETLKVKGQEDIVYEIRQTKRGPIVNDIVENIKGEIKAPISVYWTMTKIHSQHLQMGYRIGRTKSMNEMRETVAMIHAPGLNMMYGDKDGNIAWWASAKYIKHPKGVNTKYVIDAANEPLGFYDFSENPSSENPKEGYVYSANNQPDTSSFGLYQGYYATSDRGQKVMEYLSVDKKFSVEDMKTMLTDVNSVSAAPLAQIMIKSIEAKTDNEKKALEELKNWKGDHNTESIAPLIYNMIHYYIVKNTFEDELGSKDFDVFLKLALMKHTFPKLMKNEQSIWWDNVQTKDKKETAKEILQQSFTAAIAQLEQKHGNDVQQWLWKKAHLLTHNHPLGRQGGWLGWLFNVGPFGVMGGNEVLNISSFTLNDEGVYKVAHGASMRIIIDFANVNVAYNILPTGQSGNLMSPHYKDQAERYNKGEFRTMYMSEKDIKQEKNRKLTLKP